MRRRLIALVACTGCSWIWSSTLMASPPATRVATFHLDAPLERSLPLFTALGERSWADGWEPKILSGENERGSAFVTTGHHGARVTWIVIDYRPAEGRVSYARLVEDSNIGIVDVRCTPKRGGGTDVSVRYTLTPVSKEGESFVAQFLQPDHYAAMIEEWRISTSTALSRSSPP